MNKDNEKDLKQGMEQSDDLLEQLDAIGEKNSSLSQVELSDNRQNLLPNLANRTDIVSASSPNALVVLGWFFSGVFIIIIGVDIKNKTTSSNAGTSNSGQISGDKEVPDKPHQPDFKPEPPKDQNSSQQVIFNGIELPITNRLCNKKETFCIYGLAKLVQDEAGAATYNFADNANGERVTIYGDISIANLQRASDGGRTFTLAFRDDQSRTTSGWAAAGQLNLEQDPKQPGILTRFKTTESFGAKAPVGIENTSYLIPR